MGFCAKCGKPTDDDNKQFCIYCEMHAKITCETLRAPQPQAPQPQAPQPQAPQPQAPQPQAPQPDFASQTEYVPQLSFVPQYPMKWYKFLIYFALFLTAIYYINMGIDYISEPYIHISSCGYYNSDIEEIQIFHGLALIDTGIYAFYTRKRLAKYKANGLRCLYILYSLNLILSLLYRFAMLAVVGVGDVFTSSTVGSIIGMFIVISLNRKYFEKRAALFRS